VPSALRPEPTEALEPAPVSKTDSVLRARLGSALGIARLYDLDRLDLTARSTIDHDTQQAVTRALRRLSEPEQARAAGLYGFRLFGEGDDLSPVVYSLISSSAARVAAACECKPTITAGPWTSTRGSGSTSDPPPSCARC
jgi:hypothetical protein